MTAIAPDRDRIVARVRTLMAFDHGTATEAEAEAEIRNAMELAGRLMEAHAIELDEVASAADAAGGAEDPAIERDLRASPPIATIAYWEQVLVSAVLAAVPGVGS